MHDNIFYANKNHDVENVCSLFKQWKTVRYQCKQKSNAPLSILGEGKSLKMSAQLLYTGVMCA